VDGAKVVGEEGVVQSTKPVGEDFEGQGQHNNTYDRMKVGPRQ